MTKNSGLSGQPQFVKYHQDLLYAIYQRFWCDRFYQYQIRDLLELRGEDRGFMPRAANHGIFKTENSHKTRIPLRYRIPPNIRDMILNLKERQDQ